jgi:hypothetical protein
MVLRLADALGMGLREANELLNAAGLPAAYPAVRLDSADLGPYWGRARSDAGRARAAPGHDPRRAPDRHRRELRVPDSARPGHRGRQLRPRRADQPGRRPDHRQHNGLLEVVVPWFAALS